MPVKRITAAELDKIKPKTTLWDTEVRGFGARRQTEGGDVVFIWKGKSPITGKQIFLTIGRHGRGDWPLNEARTKATQFRDAVRLGRDPAAARDEQKNVLTVSELCDAYMEAVPTLLLRAGRAKKPSTIATDQARVAHIKAVLGDLRVPAVTHADVETLLHRIAAGDTADTKTGKVHGSVRRGGKGVASRTVGLLGAIFAWAVKKRLRPDNPVRGVIKFAENKRERRMTADEYHALAAGLKAAQKTNPVAVAALRFLTITGWRAGEAACLRWQDMDAVRRVATLPDSKSGKSIRPLSHAALNLITSLPRMAGNPHVFPATTGDGGTTAIPRTWGRVRELAGLPPDISPHVFRHSFVSEAADAGLAEASIAALVGHKRAGMTARYTHGADPVLLAAADTATRRILELMGEAEPAGAVVSLASHKDK